MSRINRIHPFTGRSYDEPIYVSPSGRRFYPIGGASEPAPEPTPPAGSEPTPEPEPTPADPPVDPEPPTDETPDAKATRLEAEVTKLRRENASSRTKAKADAAKEAEDAMAQKIGKAIGLVKDGDDAPTVEQLTKQLAEQTEAATSSAAAQRQAAAELVVWRNASDLGVDTVAMTDSNSFRTKIADLDPSKDSFEADVKKAAQEAAEANPKLKAAQAAGSSSADHGGSGGGANGNKPVSLDQAVSGHYGT